MWQRFTERARKTVFFAQEEAGNLGENYVSTEHLLLGLIREGDTVAARVLDRLGVSRGRIRVEIERQVVRGDGRLSQDMQLTPRAKRVIDLAYDEARQLGNNYIGTEHLLLGLLREAEGLAGRTLVKLGVELERTQQEVKQLQELGKGQIEENSLPTVQSASEKTLAAEPKLAAFAEAVTQFVQSYSDQTLAAASYYQQPAAAEQFQPREKTTSQRMASTPEGRSDLSGILSETRLRGRDILGIEEFTQDEILLVLDVAARLKTHKFDDTQTQFAKGQSLAMLFEKPSLRTRVTFEAGMTQLGGHAIYLEGRLGIRETVPDVAKNLDRWIDGIMARTFDHQTVRELADNADIPVINGLSDREHPCQAFADFQTLAERKGNLSGLTLAYIGDGNNVAHSLMLLAAKVGTHFRLACPEGYEPDKELWEIALRFADASGAILTLTHDPVAGVRDADAVYTDVWASMGQEEETAERAIIFAPFQVNAALMTHAKPDALIMHCLPAHRGEEITAEVLDGPQSVVFDQAENRLHAQKAVLALVL
jgi:ornithine carbamoyltransferase